MLSDVFPISWTPKRLRRWEKIRAKGKRHFLLWHGVIFWGGFMFVFVQLCQYAFWYYHSQSAPFGLGLHLLTGAISYPLIGWWWANKMWTMTERSYHAYRQLDTSAPSSQNDTTERVNTV